MICEQSLTEVVCSSCLTIPVCPFVAIINNFASSVYLCLSRLMPLMRGRKRQTEPWASVRSWADMGRRHFALAHCSRVSKQLS